MNFLLPLAKGNPSTTGQMDDAKHHAGTHRTDYTGQTITWEEAWASKEVLVPDNLQWGQTLPAPMAVPGITKLL